MFRLEEGEIISNCEILLIGTYVFVGTDEFLAVLRDVWERALDQWCLRGLYLVDFCKSFRYTEARKWD